MGARGKNAPTQPTRGEPSVNRYLAAAAPVRRLGSGARGAPRRPACGCSGSTGSCSTTSRTRSAAIQVHAPRPRRRTARRRARGGRSKRTARRSRPRPCTSSARSRRVRRPEIPSDPASSATRGSTPGERWPPLRRARRRWRRRAPVFLRVRRARGAPARSRSRDPDPTRSGSTGRATRDRAEGALVRRAARVALTAPAAPRVAHGGPRGRGARPRCAASRRGA